MFSINQHEDTILLLVLILHIKHFKDQLIIQYLQYKFNIIN